MKKTGMFLVALFALLFVQGDAQIIHDVEQAMLQSSMEIN